MLFSSLKHFYYFVFYYSRLKMPSHPLSELKPEDFPRIRDEEDGFNSYDEDTDE